MPVVQEQHEAEEQPIVPDTLLPEPQDTLLSETDTLQIEDTVLIDQRRVIELAIMLPFESHQT